MLASGNGDHAVHLVPTEISSRQSWAEIAHQRPEVPRPVLREWQDIERTDDLVRELPWRTVKRKPVMELVERED
jgi:hypothetical protein